MLAGYCALLKLRAENFHATSSNAYCDSGNSNRDRNRDRDYSLGYGHDRAVLI